MKPYYDVGGITIYHGKSEEILPSIETGSIGLILTDPPYNVSSRNGRSNTTIGRVGTKRGGFREIRRDFGEWDYEWDPQTFLAETCRSLRPAGSLIAFTSEMLFAPYLQSGLDHRAMLYWRKTNPAPNFRKHIVRAVEMAVWQTKGTGWTFNAGGYLPNIWDCPSVTGFSVVNNGEPRIHPNQKPEWLLKVWAGIFSGPDDIVLDPFMGSGSTLRAAKTLGRRAIGIEQEERYCEAAAERLRQEALAL